MIIVNNRDKLDWKENMTIQDVLIAEYLYYIKKASTNNFEA